METVISIPGFTSCPREAALRFPKHVIVGFATLFILSCAAPSSVASIIATIDKLDPSDGFPMPPSSVVVIDISVTVSADDAWSGLGIAGFALGGTRLLYAYDPNDAHPLHSAPGAENRFVTFFSRPRARDGGGRFGTGAYVDAIGSYYLGIVPVLEPLRVDIWVRRLPYEEGRSGYVGRIALDLSQVNDPRFRNDSPDIIVAAEPPPDSVTLLQTFADSNHHGLLIASEDGATGFYGFGVYGIPEPSAWLLIVAGAMYSRRVLRQG